MQTVTVDRSKLREVLRRNREKHIEEYAKAVEGYYAAALREQKEQLDKLEANHAHRILITEYPPENHTPDYDQTLRMLEMSIEERIVLTQAEFTRYVDDDWLWKSGFSASLTKYVG